MLFLESSKLVLFNFGPFYQGSIDIFIVIVSGGLRLNFRYSTINTIKEQEYERTFLFYIIIYSKHNDQNKLQLLLMVLRVSYSFAGKRVKKICNRISSFENSDSTRNIR